MIQGELERGLLPVTSARGFRGLGLDVLKLDLAFLVCVAYKYRKAAEEG